MSVIYFIRHGQASFASDHYDRLSDLGRRQSRILGDYLAHLGLRFDAACTGTLERQTETAEIVLSRMNDPGPTASAIKPGLNEYDSESIVSAQLPAMIERDPGLARDAEHMTDRRSFQRVFEGAMLRWASGRHDVPGVETWSDFAARVREAVEQVMSENGRGKTVAVFTSGGPTCATLHMAVGVSPAVAVRLNWQIRNTSVSEFKYSEQGIFLGSFNSVHHLQTLGEPELLTYR
ncbi:MAG: histidine phosphatase family protein [Proteobacteria bacterium]|nr:histidine phosphatase family protein [Pseudomonadota bacterium]